MPKPPKKETRVTALVYLATSNAKFALRRPFSSLGQYDATSFTRASLIRRLQSLLTPASSADPHTELAHLEYP